MAKATIEFDLEKPEDSAEFTRVTKALDMALALWDMDQHLRAETKYAPDDTPEEVVDALYKTRDKLHEILNSYSIDLDQILK